MSKNESKSRNKQRRKLLLGGGVIGAGSLTASWTKPAILSVVLPAHARVSPCPPGTVEAPDSSCVPDNPD